MLSLLGDEYAQEILTATHGSAMSAKELSAELDLARSTIYDRTEEMLEYELLVERTRIMEDGSHHSVYEANVEHLGVRLENGKFEVTVETRETPAERFTNIWSDIRRA